MLLFHLAYIIVSSLITANVALSIFFGLLETIQTNYFRSHIYQPVSGGSKAAKGATAGNSELDKYFGFLYTEDALNIPASMLVLRLFNHINLIVIRIHK